MEKLTQTSCFHFAEELASKTSIPGGGSAAALSGALGIALCSMAGNFTLGKIKYADVEEDIKILQSKAENLRLRLLELVDADAESFVPLAEAYSIPKNDPSREEVLENATLNACRAPMEMVERCAEAIELLGEMLEKGSRMLISDVGCGALLCRAAMESAAINVFINTKSLRNRSKAILLESNVERLMDEYVIKADRIVSSVMAKIR